MKNILIITILIGSILINYPSYTSNIEPFKKEIPQFDFEEHLIYQDGRIIDSQPDYSKDIKMLSKYYNHEVLQNFPQGYKIELPPKMNYDFNYSPAFTRISNNNLDIKISKEICPYDKDFKENPNDEATGMYMYFSRYLNRFVLDEQFQRENSIKIVENDWIDINGYKTRIVSFTRTPAEGSKIKQNSYLFAYIMTDKEEFYNFFFRTDSLEKNKETIYKVLNSFQKIDSIGNDAYNLELKPEIPNWNEETLNYYNNLKDTKKVVWGFFYPWALTKDYSKVEYVEQKIDYKFPILLHYMYLGHEFPMEGMKRAYERGQSVELTMQIASYNNSNYPTHNTNFDVLDGLSDEKIREFAKSAKEFGHPFLFRLNNEMNTDWCQYSGLLLLSDSDLYISIWRRIYDIFIEEGVDNAIWIFNPNDKSHPPTNWNSDVSYYPGNKYVQLFGITGYNTGTYYMEKTGENWRTFDQIYYKMAQKYRKTYSNFPWIITEFACSSVGGNKEQWINQMFESLPNYPEIKAAVWWSYADFEYIGDEEIPARKYWLDEKDEYLSQFKKGIQKQ